MATDRESEEEDLKTRSLDEHVSSNMGEGLNPGESEVKSQPQEVLSGSTACGQGVDGVATCRFFLLGRCHFGNRCRLSHSLPQSSSDVPESGHDEEQDARSRKEAGNIKKMQKRGENRKDVEGKDYTKKPRMRTADDVISRILWDPSLDPADFSVGYLDRFLGVLERAFSEFSWDTDVCSCDYSEELALPRHRIRYFTYGGRRVWDRESRTDGVFGSTGGPLEPPFAAAGEKEEGSATQETGPQEPGEELHQACLELGEGNDRGQAREAYGQEGRFPMDHRDDEEKGAGGFPRTLPEGAGDTPRDQRDLPNEPPRCKREAEGEMEVCETEAVDDPELPSLTARMSISETGHTDREGDDGEQEEWKEEWEDEEEDQLSWPSSEQSSHSPVKAETPAFTEGVRSEPLEQRPKPSRRKPTHFVTLRADTPAVLAGFQRLREEVTSLFPLSAPHWVSPESLHVTLCLLVLSGPGEVAAACQVLRDFARNRSGQRPLRLSFPPMLRHFGGRVLLLTPQPLSGLESLSKGLQEAYRQRGWLHADSASPSYHLTLAKMEGKRGEGVFQGVADAYGPAQPRAADFGKLAVSQLLLCVNGGAKMEDGFYETACVAKLR